MNSRNIRTYQLTVVAAIAMSALAVGAWITLASSRAKRAQVPAHDTHRVVDSPTVNDPFVRGASGATADGTISVPGVPGSFTPEQVASTQSGGAIGGSSGVGFDREAQGAEIVAVTDSLPSTLSLPKGASRIGTAVRFPNGVIEWRYSVIDLDLERAVDFMKQAFATNGWAMSSAVALPDQDLAKVGVFKSHLIYAAAPGWKGFATVSSKGDHPGVQIQIDLQHA